MYTIGNKVMTSACDEQGGLKLYSALQMLQDCSEMWIESEPRVKEFFAEEGMAQLLVFRQVDIERVPKYGEEVTVTSSVYGMKPMFGFRNTFIYDAAGNACYRTWSMGAFVDMVTGKLKNVSTEAIASMKIEEQKSMDYLDRRIAQPKDGWRELAPYTVCRADIDYNHHMNNANYVRLAFETLPEGFAYDRLRVEYRVPVKRGELIFPVVQEVDGRWLVRLMSGGQVASVVEFSKR
ncbi:MAG: hypothetical protein K5633_00945 [Paludibacteraceae bacterium]|nr:hypothetical protein [Paludibacteraceae bacterium]